MEHIRTTQTLQQTLVLLGMLCNVISLSAQDCNLPVPPGLDCNSAPVLCTLDGYCSTNTNENPQPAPSFFCGQIENAHWIKFVPATETIELQISPSNCNLGLQGHIYKTDYCVNYIPVSNCYDMVGVADFVLSATGLIPGEVYTLLLDGKGGDVCDYEISVLSGATQVPTWGDAGESVEICVGNTAQLQGVIFPGEDDITPIWFSEQGNFVDGNYTLNPTVNQSGLYYLMLVDTVLGCSFTDSVEVISLEPAVADIEVSGMLDCLDNPEVELFASGPSGSWALYNWYDDSGMVIDQNTNTTFVTQPGIYILESINMQTGCVAYDTVEVESNIDFPVADIQSSGELNCVNETVVLSVENDLPNTNFAFEWMTLNGNIISENSDPAVIVDQAGIYFLQVSNLNNGCTNIDSIAVIENEDKPRNADFNIKAGCAGTSSGSVKIDSVHGGAAPYLYFFNDQSTETPIFNNLSGGQYEFIIVDNIGCEWDTILQVLEQKPLELYLGNDRDVLLGDSFRLAIETNIAEENIVNFDWNSDEYLSCNDCLNPTVLPLQNTIFNLLLTDINGCTVEDQMTINVDRHPRVYFPNVFSPNGDGINDFFFVQSGKAVSGIDHFQIYDRWGGLIFEIEETLPNIPEAGWNGKANGEFVNSQVYVYQVEVTLVDGRKEVFVGDIMVVR